MDRIKVCDLALTLTLSRGRYVVRFAQDEAEVQAAQSLRHRAFFSKSGGTQATALDVDDFDRSARHILVWDRASADLVACYRVQFFEGAEIACSYSAQFYDLTALANFPGILMELGRFCLHPERHDPDILRLSWAAMAHLVDQAGVSLLFGCSSFPGADPLRHAAAIGHLSGRIAPPERLARAKVADRVAVGAFMGKGTLAEAMAGTPALLRTYLGMGAWVSDHAVVDRSMDTLHVLTGVEIAKIPPTRARALRQIVADCLGYNNTVSVTH